MATISTHVLDTATGNPAAGVLIKLQAERDGFFHPIGSGTTNADGRVGDLLEEEFKPLVTGTYRMTFDVEQYMTDSGRDKFFYPYVDITFRIERAEDHYHVPLLISPYGFSTYKGS